MRYQARTGEHRCPARGGLEPDMAEAVTTSTTTGMPMTGTTVAGVTAVPSVLVKTDPVEPDYKALYEQLKADSRKWEDRAKANKEKADAYDQLQAQANAQAEANKTLEQQVADIRDQLNASNAENLRMRVAAEKGIDAEGMKFLAGSTEDELRASADELIELAKKMAPKPAAPIIPTDGNTPSNISEPSHLGQFAQDFFGGN